MQRPNKQHSATYLSGALDKNIISGKLTGLLLCFLVTASSGMSTTAETVIADLDPEVSLKFGNIDGGKFRLQEIIRENAENGEHDEITLTATAYKIRVFIPFSRVRGDGNIWPAGADSERILNVNVTWNNAITGTGLGGNVELYSMLGNGVVKYVVIRESKQATLSASEANHEVPINLRNVDEIRVLDNYSTPRISNFKLKYGNDTLVDESGDVIRATSRKQSQDLNPTTGYSARQPLLHKFVEPGRPLGFVNESEHTVYLSDSGSGGTFYVYTKGLAFDENLFANSINVETEERKMIVKKAQQRRANGSTLKVAPRIS